MQQRSHRVNARKTAEAYDDLIEWSEQSSAYRLFRERVYGDPTGQLGVADEFQLNQIIGKLVLQPADSVLDLGCAGGSVTTEIARRTGCSITGLDIARRAIRRANDRNSNPQIRFVEGDMDHLDLAPSTFDAVVAIDSFYLARDGLTTLSQLVRSLAADGRIGLLCSEVIGPARTVGRAATWLKKLGLEVRTHDLSQREWSSWHRQGRALDELRPVFRAEGRGALYRILRQELEHFLPLVKRRQIRRFLYVGRLVTPPAFPDRCQQT